MKQSTFAQRTFGFLILTSALTSIVAVSTASAGSTLRPKQTRASFKAELDAQLQQNKVACKVASECEAVAVGVKPCGGPVEYLYVSAGTKAKIGDAIKDLTQTIAEMDRTANSEGGLMGTCDVEEKPEATCSSGTCVKAPPKKL